MAYFRVGASAFGALGSFYYYGYAFFQVPSGILLDRFGVKKILGASILLCTLGSAATLLPYFGLAALGRFLIGVGSSASFLVCMKVATEHFKPDFLPVISGLSVFSGTVGAIGSLRLIPVCSQNWGWQGTLYGLVGFGFLTFLIFFCVYRHQRKDDAMHVDFSAMLRNVGAVLKRKQTWLVGLFGALAYVPLAAFADLWGAPFLVKQFGLSVSEAGSLTAYTYLGLGLGAPFTGKLLEKVKSYRLCFFTSSSLSAVLFTSVLFLPAAYVGSVPFLLMGLGVSLSPQILAFTYVCRINDEHMSATASGLHNSFCMLSGVVMMPLVGWLIEFFAGDGIHAAAHYSSALLVVSFSLAFSAFVGLLITKPRR